MNELQTKLLQLLHSNAKLTSSELSIMLGQPEEIITAQIEEMEKNRPDHGLRCGNQHRNA